MKTFLSNSSKRARTVIVFVHIDVTIPLLHFAGTVTHKINRPPTCVPYNINPIFYCFSNLCKVKIQIRDAVIVFNGIVVHKSISRTKSVLNDRQWFVVPFMQLVAGNTHALWINRPSPLGGFQVRIDHGTKHIPIRKIFQNFRISTGTTARIIAETDVIHSICLQNL